MLYISDNAHLMSRQVAKFHGVTPSDIKVLGANKLHFKPIFGLSLEKMLGEPAFSVGFGLTRLGQKKFRGAAPPRG